MKKYWLPRFTQSQGVSNLRKILILIISLAQGIPAYAGISPYSTDELEELERQFVQQINQSDSVVREPLAIQYINHIGKELSYPAKISTPYFFIVKSSEINAFAGPGGYIGLNTQLILATENESELAGVMAHEMAHVRLHHLYRMLEHQKQMRIPMLASLLASVALGVLNPTLGSGAIAASLTGFAQDSINFTRSNEKEADRIGIHMLQQAGFDPHGMVSFFKKMQQTSRYYYTANIPAILRTHPLDEDRIAEAENRSMSIKNKPAASTVDYSLFKELIRTSIAPESQKLVEYYQKSCRQGVACQYGYALTLMQLNKFNQALSILTSLHNQDNNNLFYEIALSQAEIGEKMYDAGLKRLAELQKNYPDNYAVLRARAQELLATNHPNQAADILLKGSRQFKKDLPLCEELARAQSAAHQTGYAYFTEAKCQLLQGDARDAIRKLTLVKTLAKQDHYLYERAQAMIDEIKMMLE